MSWLALLPGWALAQDAYRTAPGATTINVNEAKALFDRGAKFADVRVEGEWERGHIPRSLAMGTKFEIDAAKLLAFARKEDEVVFYCNNAQCANPYYAARLAYDRGYRKLYQFRDGYDAWRAKALPIESAH